jgi:hypothetical protein
MPGTHFIQLRLAGRTPFVVGIIMTYFRSRERKFIAMGHVSELSIVTMHCGQWLVETSPISSINLDPPDEKLITTEIVRRIPVE